MDRLRHLFARARALPPLRLDALLGLLWFVEASVEVLIIVHDAEHLASSAGEIVTPTSGW